MLKEYKPTNSERAMGKCLSFLTLNHTKLWNTFQTPSEEINPGNYFSCLKWLPNLPLYSWLLRINFNWLKYLQTTVDEHQRKAHGGTDKLYFKEVFNTQQWLWLEQNVEQLLIQGTSSILYWETNKVPEEKTLCGCTAKDHFFALVQTEIKQAPH